MRSQRANKTVSRPHFRAGLVVARHPAEVVGRPARERDVGGRGLRQAGRRTAGEGLHRARDLLVRGEPAGEEQRPVAVTVVVRLAEREDHDSERAMLAGATSALLHHRIGRVVDVEGRRRARKPARRFGSAAFTFSSAVTLGFTGVSTAASSRLGLGRLVDTDRITCSAARRGRALSAIFFASACWKGLRAGLLPHGGLVVPAKAGAERSASSAGTSARQARVAGGRQIVFRGVSCPRSGLAVGQGSTVSGVASPPFEGRPREGPC